jgi:hypothetical protein
MITSVPIQRLCPTGTGLGATGDAAFAHRRKGGQHDRRRGALAWPDITVGVFAVLVFFGILEIVAAFELKKA